MKPTIQFNDKSRRDQSDRDFRPGSVFPKIDFSYQGSSVANMGGRCFGSRQPSFRSISQDYFKNEARPSFVTEAGLFTLIVMTAALPIYNSAIALLDLVRSLGAI